MVYLQLKNKLSKMTEVEREDCIDQMDEVEFDIYIVSLCDNINQLKFYDAIEDNDIESIKLLLKLPDVKVDRDNDFSIRIALYNKNLKIVKFLFKLHDPKKFQQSTIKRLIKFVNNSNL